GTLSPAMMPGSGSTRSTRYSVSVPVAPLQLSVIDVSVTDVTVSVGAPGGSGRVAAAASFPNAEQPPGLHARTRYTYDVSAESPVSWKVVAPDTVVSGA